MVLLLVQRRTISRRFWNVAISLTEQHLLVVEHHRLTATSSPCQPLQDFGCHCNRQTLLGLVSLLGDSSIRSSQYDADSIREIPLILHFLNYQHRLFAIWNPWDNSKRLLQLQLHHVDGLQSTLIRVRTMRHILLFVCGIIQHELDNE